MKGDRRVRHGRATGLGLAFLLALAGSRADAGATVCGTIITNVAAAAMGSGFPAFVQYEVSYNATCTVMVLCAPVVQLRKFANGGYLTEGAAGATVTFSICVENQTADTVWAVSMTDKLPDNMTFVDAGTGGAYDLTAPNLGAAALVSASTVALLTTAPLGSTPGAGQGVNYYMRWTYPGIGPQKSACVVYRAKIL